METIFLTVTLPRGEDEVDIEVEVRGTYYPARDATPPRYDCGGEPPEPATFEIDSVRCGGVEVDAAVENEVEAALGGIERACLERIAE